MKKLLLLALSIGLLPQAFAFPIYDPFADATGTPGGTAYTAGSTLAGQTNAFLDPWNSINTSAVGAPIAISNINLSYPSLPSSTGGSMVMTHSDGKSARIPTRGF